MTSSSAGVITKHNLITVVLILLIAIYFANRFGLIDVPGQLASKERSDGALRHFNSRLTFMVG